MRSADKQASPEPIARANSIKSLLRELEAELAQETVRAEKQTGRVLQIAHETINNVNGGGKVGH